MERSSKSGDGRWPVWVQFALGTAGIAVTAAGLYELNRAQPRSRPSSHQIAALEAENARLSAELARARSIAERPSVVSDSQAAALAEIRRRREIANLLSQLQLEGYRCIDGHLFRQANGGWENTGLCPR